MAYATPGTVAAGDVATAAAWNVLVGNDVAFRDSTGVVPPMCQVRRTTALTGYTSAAEITWQSTGYDTNTMYSAGSPTRITINTTGIYLVTFTGGYGGSATITRALPRIFKNGVAVAEQESMGVAVGGSFSMATVLNLTATDYLTAGVLLLGGSAYSIGGSSTTEASDQTRLAVQLLGRTS